MERAAPFKAAASRFTSGNDEFTGKFGVNLPVRSLSNTAFLKWRQDAARSPETACARTIERISPPRTAWSGVAQSAPVLCATTSARPIEAEIRRNVRPERFKNPV